MESLIAVLYWVGVVFLCITSPLGAFVLFASIRLYLKRRKQIRNSIQNVGENAVFVRNGKVLE